MNKSSKIYIAGHKGLVGSAILRHLTQNGYANLVLRAREEVDLTDKTATQKFFAMEKPEYVFLAAAKVGGILANNMFPADFIRENLAIQNHVLDAAYHIGTKKLLLLGSSCIYPRDCLQPIKEEYFLTGPLEKTNAAYSVAKIAGVIEAQAYRQQYGCNFISVMPTNIYGPNDNFDPQTSHVFPALIRKFYEAVKSNAETITLWGTGEPRREFMHVDDLASACIFLMENYNSPEIINVGTGEDISITNFAQLLKKISGYEGKIAWDTARPDGTMRKLLDVSRLHALGWRHKTSLEEGLKTTYQGFLNDAANKI